ncbi:MAG: GNAT family N-acetyltransferase, partial [Defluviitaleaceae bacterium]|nr:GNAT family N-acetyltransferase [Defluviitaleaceae bacterium]
MDKIEALLAGKPELVLHDIKINFQNLHLVLPCWEYLESYRQGILEYMAYRVEDFAYPKITTNRDAKTYFKRLERFRKGKVPEGFVPSSSFWLVDGTNYLGSGDVRHHLNESLCRLGGHIGYSIRPSAWKQGLGTIQLSLLLDEAEKLAITRPTITCFDDNIASIKVIEKNGGIRVNMITNRVRGEKRLTRIYEIDLTRRQ